VNFREFLKYTAAGRLVLIPARLVVVAGPYACRQLGQMLRWTFSSKEYYNHSYHLTRLNRNYLASYISVVSGQPLPEVDKYITELETDTAFRNTLEQLTLNSPARHSCDTEPRYGRRLGWYALIRATKPSVVVETGVDRGLGTAVIAAALKRNADEGLCHRHHNRLRTSARGTLQVFLQNSHWRFGDVIEGIQTTGGRFFARQQSRPGI
jgi:hypothetical protein